MVCCCASWDNSSRRWRRPPTSAPRSLRAPRQGLGGGVRLSLVDRHWEYCRGCVGRRFVDAVLPSISSALAGCACTLPHRYRRLRVMIATKHRTGLLIIWRDHYGEGKPSDESIESL